MLKNSDVVKRDLKLNHLNFDNDEKDAIKRALSGKEHRKFLNARFMGNNKLTSFYEKVTL